MASHSIHENQPQKDRTHSKNGILKPDFKFMRGCLMFLGVCTLLLLLSKQDSLYSGNQNTKFLHGMAWAGVGYLNQDWLAQTRDGLPLFSGLVYAIYAFFSPRIVYFLYAMLLGVLFFGLAGVLSMTFGIRRGSPKYDILCGSIFLILACFQNTLFGVAGQYLLGGYFQPCVFGVFIILSIRLFLERRETWASASLALAYLMHPAYLFIGSLLVLVYLFEVVREKRGWKAILGTIGPFLVCAVSYLLYLRVAFSPSSDQAYETALRVLAVERIPGHSLIGMWAGPSAFAKLVVVLLSLYLLRGKPLFRILSWLTVATVAFTLAQAVIGSHSLALLAPWRASVVIMPLAIFSVIAWLIHRLPETSEQKLLTRRKVGVSVAVLMFLVLIVYGVGRNYQNFKKHSKRREMALLQYIDVHKQAQDMYIIPNRNRSFDKFRLNTGASAFANWKSHPYKDVEVIEWSHRNDLADRLYAASSQELPEILDVLKSQYHVTHLVAKPGAEWGSCPQLTTEFSDKSYVLYRILP